MFDVSNWVACLNGENGPGGTPSHEALSVSSQGALEISSVAGQPPSLDRSHCSPPRLVAKSLKRDERCRPSSQRPQYPTLYRRLKRRLGSLRPKFYKGSVVRSGKKATHKYPRIEGGLPGPSRLQGPVPESNSVSCDGQLNSPPNVPQHSKDTQRVLSLLIIIYVISLTCVNTFITSNHIDISHEDKYNHKSNS